MSPSHRTSWGLWQLLEDGAENDPSEAQVLGAEGFPMEGRVWLFPRAPKPGWVELSQRHLQNHRGFVQVIFVSFLVKLGFFSSSFSVFLRDY